LAELFAGPFAAVLLENTLNADPMASAIFVSVPSASFLAGFDISNPPFEEPRPSLAGAPGAPGAPVKLQILPGLRHYATGLRP
jgi:hypothetical protein